MEILIIVGVVISITLSTGAIFLGIMNLKMHGLSKDLHKEAFSEIEVLRRTK